MYVCMYVQGKCYACVYVHMYVYVSYEAMAAVAVPCIINVSMYVCMYVCMYVFAHGAITRKEPLPRTSVIRKPPPPLLGFSTSFCAAHQLLLLLFLCCCCCIRLIHTSYIHTYIHIIYMQSTATAA